MAGRILTARRSLPYAGKRVKKGEQFFARGGDARALVAVGYASETPTPIQPPASTPHVDPKPEPPPALPDDTQPEPDSVILDPPTAEVPSEPLPDEEPSEDFSAMGTRRTRPYRRRGGKAPEE